MRVRIMALFDGEIMFYEMESSDTIDNVKAKIDNVKATIQDEKDRGPLSRPLLARRPVPDQLGAFPPSSPLRDPLRQVSASHDKC
jgi:hypothetical protein